MIKKVVPRENKTGKPIGPTTLPKRSLALFAKGFCMGASDVVPGVSGGTMALILGIYEELIKAIKSFDLAFIRLLLRGRFIQARNHVPLGFLLPLGAGILMAIFTFARGLSWLLVNYPVAVWSFFFGLVLASALVVGRRIRNWNRLTVIGLVLTTAAAFEIVGLVPVHTPESLPFIFLCGAIAICAMILPGISGSFILVLLGKYHYILDAVGRVDVVVLGVFTAGTATGIALFVRLLSWLLKRYYHPTMAALTGLMIGSLRKIWPWKSVVADVANKQEMVVNRLPQQVDLEVWMALGLALLGAMLVLVLQRLARQSPPERGASARA
jgi:putative membrane protein